MTVEVVVDEQLKDCENGQAAEEADQAFLQDEVVDNARAVSKEDVLLLFFLLLLNFFNARRSPTIVNDLIIHVHQLVVIFFAQIAKLVINKDAFILFFVDPVEALR